MFKMFQEVNGSSLLVQHFNNNAVFTMGITVQPFGKRTRSVSKPGSFKFKKSIY
jgi:hypothetical protein